MPVLSYTYESLQLLFEELGLALSKPISRLLAWLMIALLERHGRIYSVWRKNYPTMKPPIWRGVNISVASCPTLASTWSPLHRRCGVLCF